MVTSFQIRAVKLKNVDAIAAARDELAGPTAQEIGDLDRRIVLRRVPAFGIRERQHGAPSSAQLVPSKAHTCTPLTARPKSCPAVDDEGWLLFNCPVLSVE